MSGASGGDLKQNRPIDRAARHIYKQLTNAGRRRHDLIFAADCLTYERRRFAALTNQLGERSALTSPAQPAVNATSATAAAAAAAAAAKIVDEATAQRKQQRTHATALSSKDVALIERCQINASMADAVHSGYVS